MEEVVALLRSERKRQKISQTRVGEAAGLSLRHISGWENGEVDRNLKGEDLLKIIAFLRVPFHTVIALLDAQAAEELQQAAILTAEEEQMISQLKPGQRAALIALIRQMLDEGE